MALDDAARAEDELLQLSRRLLDVIASGDWDAYVAICDPSLTCFEPEARGERVTGLDFHHFYFRERRPAEAAQTTLIEPEVRMLGPDAAAVTYVRLTQSRDAAGAACTSRAEETRIWQRRDGRWKLVHVHRSANP
jgi:calcium/calmodulin-dependent protein kinase (CaM kinase) II